MDTRYGPIPLDSFKDYHKSLINRIWILLPLREEDCPTLEQKIERLNRELCGMVSTMPQFSAHILTVINLLENLKIENDFKLYRSDVLRCCELIRKLDGDYNVR